MNETTASIHARNLDNLIEGDASVDIRDRERCARDTSLFYVKPAIVIYPKTTRDIVQVLAYIRTQNEQGGHMSLTMRAAGTCMTGGPLTESIVVDVTRYMNRMISISSTSAEVEPGMFYRDFEKETLEKGWFMPSYPASRELAAIGGIVSNNAGGEKTLTYGKTERYVQQLNVVYANGETDLLQPLSGEILLQKLSEKTESGRIHKAMYDLVTSHAEIINHARPTVSKNSSGYYLWNVYDKKTGVFDIIKLIVGSQGTLACVTSATFTGVRPKQHSRMLIMFVPSTSHLGTIIPKLLQHKPETIESYDDHTFKIAIRFFKDIALHMGGSMLTLGWQFLPEFWMAFIGGVPKIILMAEFRGDTEAEVIQAVTEAEEDMQQFNVPLKKTESEQEAKKYWTFRRESFNLLRSKLQGFRTAPTIDDIIVHPIDLPTFLPKLETIFAKYDLIYTVAGHMGDANFHIIPLVDIHKEGVIETLHQLMDEVYDLVFQYGGSMSAEHNDGLLRTAYLPKMFSPEIISLFEQTKDIFDPEHILNPGKKVYGDKEYAWKHVDSV